MLLTKQNPVKAYWKWRYCSTHSWPRH